MWHIFLASPWRRVEVGEGDKRGDIRKTVDMGDLRKWSVLGIGRKVNIWNGKIKYK